MVKECLNVFFRYESDFGEREGSSCPLKETLGFSTIVLYCLGSYRKLQIVLKPLKQPLKICLFLHSFILENPPGAIDVE